MPRCAVPKLEQMTYLSMSPRVNTEESVGNG
jgi:hypothetical protein